MHRERSIRAEDASFLKGRGDNSALRKKRKEDGTRGRIKSNANSDKAAVILLFSLKVALLTKQNNVVPLGAKITCWLDRVSFC